MGLFDFFKKGREQAAAPRATGQPRTAAKPATPVTAPQQRKYTVKSGDSLSKIAKQFYGDPIQWKVIYEANRDKISNPDLIHPGLELVIPEQGKKL